MAVGTRKFQLRLIKPSRFLDRLTRVRDATKVGFSIIVQIGTLCRRMPNFIEKAARAVATKVQKKAAMQAAD